MLELVSHPLIALLILLAVLVFVHELGHFLVGKAFGIGVETFSIGFGPRLFGIRIGNTEYRVAVIPLGGYVKFAGSFPTEDVPEEFKGKELLNASLPAQTLTMAAGPLANFLLALLVYFGMGMKGIEHPAAIIGQVRPDSPAALAGLEPGDRVVEVDGVSVASWYDLQDTILKSPGKTLAFQVQRKDEQIGLAVTPQGVALEDLAGRTLEQGQIGIGYGFVPPVLSLIAGPSPARSAGMQIGFTVRAAGFDDSEVSIGTWSEFEEALQYAFDQKAEHIWLAEGLEKDGQRISVATTSWYTMQGEELELANLLGFVDSQLTIDEVHEPADKNLQKGDRILAFNSEASPDIFSLQNALRTNERETVQLSIQRGQELKTIEVPLKAVEVQKAQGKVVQYALPVTFLGRLIPPPPYVEIHDSVPEAFTFALSTTWEQSVRLVEVVGGLFTGDIPLKSLGGPILIAKVAGDSAKAGWQTFLSSLALISINLGVLNLFPIPVLDGGRLVLIGFEAVLRRRLSPIAIENFQKLGFILLLALVVLATYNDLSRFWSAMLREISGFFK
ncbi:MAG: RIP metalloprotease RseP [Deltaproteobacteria bacterium]|nr:RIP metalloprotease RseP [Deltaproteobacteria bacterium]